jgi:cutinase
MHNVIPNLPVAIRSQIIGGVLFGDTKNKQNSATIRDFPGEKLLSICAQDDGVCWGGLNVTSGHLVYTQNGDIDKAIAFLSSKIDLVIKR